MRLIFVAALSACCACANATTLSTGVHTARQGLHAITPALEALPQERWARELREATARCEQLELVTESDRHDCLGVAYERARIMERFQELYDDAATALKEAEDLARALEALQ